MTEKKEEIWSDDNHNTGLTMEYGNIANFVPETKPETRSEKIKFISDHERRGGSNHLGNNWKPSYCHNVKLYGSVNIPDPYGNLVNQENFMQNWYDFSYEDIRSRFEENHPNYTFRMTGRSGGYLSLGTTRYKLSRLSDPIPEPGLDDETEEYERYFSAYNRWLSFHDRILQPVHMNHFLKLREIVRYIAISNRLTQRLSNPIELISMLHKNRSFYECGMTDHDPSPGNIFQRFYSTNGIMYDAIKPIEVDLSRQLEKEIVRFSKQYDITKDAAKERYISWYGVDHLSEPDPIHSWDEEDVNELFDLLWAFAEVTQELAISLAGACFFHYCDRIASEGEE